jgi:hypothetical protein
MKSSLALTLSLLAVTGGISALVAEPNWPRFASPAGSGHSTETTLPTKWDASAVAWKAKLKGSGQSSVVNWGDRLFLTSAEPGGAKRLVHCLDRKSGSLLSEREFAVAAPEMVYNMNPGASPGCATASERVVAFFGPGRIHCFDLNGKPKWSRNLGKFPGDWGSRCVAHLRPQPRHPELRCRGSLLARGSEQENR